MLQLNGYLLGTRHFGVEMNYENEAARIRSEMPAVPSVVIIGSSSFWNHDSEEICKHVGSELGNLSPLNLITGGVKGVGETVGRSFNATSKRHGESKRIFHILPFGSDGWDYGATLFAGTNMMDRREVLGRLAHTYIAIEGGPGTLHEAEVARRNRAIVIPVARTGGVAANLYESTTWPEASQLANWQKMLDTKASPQRIAAAVVELAKWSMSCGA